MNTSQDGVAQGGPPPAQGGGGGGGDDSKRQGLISINDLNYVLPPDLSVSVNRTHTNHYFQNPEYNDSQRAICILNSGAHYGDMRLSSLEFGVRLDAQTPRVADDDRVSGYFGVHGSAMNLIRTLTISSRSGDELVRLNNLDLLSYMVTPFKHSQDWCKTVGAAAGYNSIVDCGLATDTNTTFFSIPLYMLTDLFAYGRLLPPMILSGLRIEIEWQKPNQAFTFFRQIPTAGAVVGPAPIAPGLAPPSYKIFNPYIAMYAIQLTDGVQRALNELSAVNGLEIVYCDYEPTSQNLDSVVGVKPTQLEVRKASSRALKAFASTRVTGDINNPLTDSYATAPWDYRRYQWQLGSLYFPQQAIVATNNGSNASSIANNIPESYKQTLITFGKYKADASRAAVEMRNKQSGTDVFSHLGALAAVTNTTYEQVAIAHAGVRASTLGKWGTYANGASILTVLLERSDLFNLSGVPINNSRVLSARVEYDSTAAVARTFTIFLKYVRLARVFLNNVEVEQ